MQKQKRFNDQFWIIFPLFLDKNIAKFNKSKLNIYYRFVILEVLLIFCLLNQFVLIFCLLNQFVKPVC